MCAQDLVLRSGVRTRITVGALLLAPLGLFAAGSPVVCAAPLPADAVYRNGYVYTLDEKTSIRHALAVRSGRIVYVGDDAGVARFIGGRTTVVNLNGRMLMPGLVDGHMHPLQGGAALLKCNLQYKRLTIAQMQARIQGCLDNTRNREPDGWLEVVNWFQEAMLPAGTVANRGVLDSLHTHRPIQVMSSFGHTVLANSRALALAQLTASTPDPLGGRIAHDAAGAPTGILEDAAHQAVTRLLPKPTPEDDIRSAEAALGAMRRQGITTFLDAAADQTTVAAFAAVQHAGRLTARAHFAILIPPPAGTHPIAAVRAVDDLARQYDQGPIVADPRITVRNAKLFLDGVITAPACTGAMLAPYFVNQGTAADPHWVPGTNRGPEVYFPAPILSALLVALANAGLEPHMHADGDRAVREGLDAVQVLRGTVPGRDIRVALAHDEIVDPSDFRRYAALNVIPVLSFQWEKPAPDTVDGAKDFLGPTRYKFMEPAAFLADAGARIAYGSDWPVNTLNEWFALKVGVTRTNEPEAGPNYAGRLSADRGLSRAAVLRAITMNASYELHQDMLTGSLEPGKLADFIVLDRNFFEIPEEEIANIQVLETVIGGRVVYRADDRSQH